MYYLTTHSTHFIYGYMEGNVLFNDALSTFYLRLYGVGHMVKDHSESDRGNPLPLPHGQHFPTSNKGSFICTISRSFSFQSNMNSEVYPLPVMWLPTCNCG